MLFKQSDLTSNPFQEASNILNESVYLDESEAVVSAKAIPVVENGRIGAFVVRLEDLSCLVEDHGVSYEDAMNVIAESNGIDMDHLAVAVKETTIMANPDIVNELSNIVISPLPKTDSMYQFTEACVDAFVESGDVSYMDLLVEETTKEAIKNAKIFKMIKQRASKYEHKMDNKNFRIDRDLESNKLDMKNEKSNIKKLLKTVKHYGYNTPKALIQKAILTLRKKYNQILQNIPNDPSQRKWYQNILIVIEKTINKIGQYINFYTADEDKMKEWNRELVKDYQKLNDIAQKHGIDSPEFKSQQRFNQHMSNSANKFARARYTTTATSGFKTFDYYDYD